MEIFKERCIRKKKKEINLRKVRRKNQMKKWVMLIMNRDNKT
jgi:hypothetical protein